MIQVIRASQQEQEISLQDQIPLKDNRKAYLYTIIICLSTLFSGYSLTLIAATNLSGLIVYYHIDLSTQSTLSLLNGVLPAGGMLGAILIPTFITLTTKKKFIYYISGVSLIVCGLSLVPELLVLVLSRFLLGVLNGLQMSLASAFIKEVFPSHIRKPLGGIYSACRIFGMLTCYFIAEVSGYAFSDTKHILTFLGPAIICIIQSILFYSLMPESIVEMITKKQEERAKQCLAKFYCASNIDRRYQQMKMEISAAIQRTLSFEKIRMLNRKNLCSLHMAMLRQFCGETYIVIYARQIMKNMDSPYADVTPAIVNAIQLISSIIGIFTVQHASRYKLLISSCCILALLNVFIGLTDLYNMPVQCLITMSIFMIPNGIGLSSVAWSYPSELVPASQGKYSSFLNWTCSTLVAMIPPYITRTNQDESGYLVFFFFAFYLSIAFLINISLLPKIDRAIGESQQTLLISGR